MCCRGVALSACVSQELEFATASHKTLICQQLYNRVSHGLPLLLFWHLLWEFMQAPCRHCYFVLPQLRLVVNRHAGRLVVYSITIPSPSRSGLSSLSWCCLCCGVTQTLGGFDAIYAFGIAAEGVVGVSHEDPCLFVGLALVIVCLSVSLPARPC